jgi:predicted kinase
MATLVLFNGPPASGKSTLAERFVSEHPLALNLDVDVIRGLLGRWIEQPLEAGLAARRLAIAMITAHLKAGHHVIVPQFLGRVDFIEQLNAAASSSGSAFVEVALMTTREDAIQWFHERSAEPTNQQHVDATALVAQSVGGDPVGGMYDAFRRVVDGRPQTLVIPVIRNDVDATYRTLMTSVGSIT